MRDESRVGMRFVTGDCRDDKCRDKGIGCKPPEAVRTFHAKEILFSSNGRRPTFRWVKRYGFFRVKHVQTNAQRSVAGVARGAVIASGLSRRSSWSRVIRPRSETRS